MPHVSFDPSIRSSYQLFLYLRHPAKPFQKPTYHEILNNTATNAGIDSHLSVPATTRREKEERGKKEDSEEKKRLATERRQQQQQQQPKQALGDNTDLT